MATTRATSYAILLLGIFACSLSVIFLKSSQTHPLWLASIRLLVASVALLPMFLMGIRQTGITRRAIRQSVPGALLLSVHFITWTMGARATAAANGTVIINLAPVVMPIIMWLLNRERITRAEAAGTLLSMAGVAVLVATHFQAGLSHAIGDLTCFGSMVLFCFYISLGRRNGAGQNLWVYLVPLYAMAGLISAGFALVARAPLSPISAKEIGLLLSLGLVPTVVGHSILNWCIRHMRGQVISVTSLLAQSGFAAVLAYYLFGEKPDIWFYPACALIFIGALFVVVPSRKPVTVEPAE